MKIIGYGIVSKNDMSTLVTTKSSRPTSKIYTSESKANSVLNQKINPILRIMDKYPLQRQKYMQRLADVQQYKVVPIYIFESDLE